MKIETLSEPPDNKLLNGNNHTPLIKRVLLAGGRTANVIKAGYFIGIGCGSIGISEDVLPISLAYNVGPLFLDIVLNKDKFSKERAIGYAAYGAGVATVYVDRIWSFCTDLVDKLQ